MAGQLSIRKMNIIVAASCLKDAKERNLPQGWIDRNRKELNHQVKLFKQVCNNSRLDHNVNFQGGSPTNISAIDLMEMGY